MSKRIVIDGKDLTSKLTHVGYSVSHKKIRGQNAGYMLDGSYIDDVIAVKCNITCYCMPMSETELSEVLTLLSKEYLTVEFFDPMKNEYRFAQMMPEDVKQKYVGEGPNGISYWTGTVISLKEQ